MIAAKELKIGNWVLVGKNYYQVIGIHKRNTCDLKGWNVVYYSQLEPIPLTPEILEKAGFKKGEYCWYKKNYVTELNEVFSIHINAETKRCAVGEVYADLDHGGYAMTSKIIKHLHQLQNLYFALTGEELEISL